MSIAKFTKSPLIEVVCGVEFNAPEFSSVHFGMYWQAIQERFPSSPLDRPPIEGIELLSILPSLRRVWFESLDKKQLIQLQSNRFHYNWRRQSEADEYPHFKEIYPKFVREWQHFQSWWLTTGNPALQPIRYELTYLNQIDNNFSWNEAADHGKIFTFIEKDWSSSLKETNFFNCNFEIETTEEIGILSVSLNQVMRFDDNTPAVIFELTTSSIDARMNLEKWFNLAHERTVYTFLDLIREEIKQEWGFIWLDQ